MATAIDNSSLLLFRVGPVLCCAPSLPIDSIIPPPTLTRPPGTDASKPGIFRHAGHIVSSLDLRYKFGVEEEYRTNPGRMIVTEIEPGRIGFWVDEILDVIEFPSSGWGSLPAHLPRGVFSRTLILDKKIFLYAEFAQLYKIPTSGYLRVYIEQLLQEQHHEEIKQAIGETSLKPPVSQFNSTTAEKITPQHNITNVQSESNTNASTSKLTALNSSKKPASNKKAEQTSLTTKTSSTIHKLNTGKSGSSSKASTSKQEDNNTPGVTPKSKSRNTVESNSILTSSTTQAVDTIKSKQGNTASSPILVKSELDKAAQQKPSRVKIQTTSIDSQVTTVNDDQKLKLPDNTGKSINTTNSNSSSYKRSKDRTPLTTAAISNKSDHTAVHATQRPSMQHNQNTSEHNSDESNIALKNDKPSSLIPGMFFLFLFISSIAGLTWYLIHEPDTAVVMSKPKYQPTKTVPETESYLILTPHEDSPVADELPANDTMVATTENTALSRDESSPDSDGNNDIISTSAVDTIDESSVATKAEETNAVRTTEIAKDEVIDQSETPVTYKADIQKDDEGITIILEAPEETDVFKLLDANQHTDKVQPDVSLTEKVNDATFNDAVSNELSTSNELKQPDSFVQDKPVEKIPTSRIVSTEIIHIVVKGDTLWHIAIKYVNNPYKYPELARLSNIKNPDLIYPGNRVRIIKRRKQYR